jgi:hypothetical protein
MRRIILILPILLIFALGCKKDSSLSQALLRDQVGTLSWGGEPFLDGLGMTFETDDKTYGLPGSRDDYDHILPDSLVSIRIKADIQLTGDTTIRGWGVKLPEATLVKASVM